MSFDWLLLSDSVRGPSHWADCFCSAFQLCIHKTSPRLQGIPSCESVHLLAVLPALQGRSSFRFVCSQELQTSTMTAAFVIIPFANSSKLKLTPRNHTPDMPQLDRSALPKKNCLASLQQMTGCLFCAHPV